ncbi:uncharacterized protein LOC114074695 isoform X3 [Solanum pennellii]|uniref:Uncharacterized protein LOC114074695 isoform X3 n=1 Tax=Solanum pennellii TaxID=28526 RepID=A0ABM1UYC2_SOLPN|nr:uncharacterized protein LOC114074695 isoform X3 [Solanum pennellii]
MELQLDKYKNSSAKTRTVLVIQLCSCDEYQQQKSILKLRVYELLCCRLLVWTFEQYYRKDMSPMDREYQQREEVTALCANLVTSNTDGPQVSTMERVPCSCDDFNLDILAFLSRVYFPEVGELPCLGDFTTSTWLGNTAIKMYFAVQ